MASATQLETAAAATEDAAGDAGGRKPIPMTERAGLTLQPSAVKNIPGVERKNHLSVNPQNAVLIAAYTEVIMKHFLKKIADSFKSRNKQTRLTNQMIRDRLSALDCILARFGITNSTHVIVGTKPTPQVKEERLISLLTAQSKPKPGGQRKKKVAANGDSNGKKRKRTGEEAPHDDDEEEASPPPKRKKQRKNKKT
jgi:hypothetical protein